KVLYIVALAAARVLVRHEKSVKEVRVVVAMVDDVPVRSDVPAAQGRISIDVMGVPVTKMLHVGMPGFDRAEHLLLVVTILKEARARPTRVWAGTNNAIYLDVVLRAFTAIGSQEASAGLIGVVSVALIKDCFERSARN